MASIAQLEIFNQQAHTMFVDMLAENFYQFNQASQGTLILSTGEALKGDYSEEAFFQYVEGLIVRRDPSVDNAIATKRLAHDKTNTIKIGMGTARLELTRAHMDWIGQNPFMQASIFAEMMAQQAMRDHLHRATRIIRACLTGRSDVVYDVSGAGSTDRANKATFSNLALCANKFGDASSSLRAWIMHNTAYVNDILLGNLANANSLFTFGTVRVRTDAEGRPIITSDNQELIQTGSPNKFITLGLQQGAYYVQDNDDWEEASEVVTGNTNIKRYWQAQWSSQFDVLGYKYDLATMTAGSPPSDAALASSLNWDRDTTQHKNTAGVMLVSSMT